MLDDTRRFLSTYDWVFYITNSNNIKLSPAENRGDRIGRYRLLGLLATGGMAEVYLALSGELSGFRTLVVVKRILPHLASNSQFIQMFFDEARIVALLNHPNIVRIIEVGQDEDEYFLAMEVVQGRPLSSVLRRAAKRQSPLSHAQSAFILAQAGNGLGYAHNLADADGHPMNVVHRDVSPQNILVSFEGAVKVIDFGVARALGRVTETRPGGLKGKIQYMAPEQAEAGQVDQRSDVFSLGVVLWEALCERRLFRRDSELATMRAIVEEPILPPSKIVRMAPRLEQIVMRALEKDPANRFQNAEEMALALERFAFASEGFSPLQVGTTLKALFWSDFTRWKRTVAAAMDLEGSPEQWPSTSGTFLRAPGSEVQSRGPTVALSPGEGGRPPALVSTQEIRSSHTAPSTEYTLPDAPSHRARASLTMGLGALGVLVLVIVLGAVAVSRPRATITVVRPPTDTSPIRVEALVREPTRSRTPPGDFVAAAPPEMSGAAPVPAAPPTLTGFARATNAPFAWESPARSHRETAPPTRTAARHPAHSATAKATKPRKATNPVIAARVPARGAPATCSIVVGTKPWSEVWIDGRNTKKHTPYAENISCGVHKLSFRRWDLDVEKTVNVTVRPGEVLKESFALKD